MFDSDHTQYVLGGKSFLQRREEERLDRERRDAAPKTFHKFAELPKEVQKTVWKHAFHDSLIDGRLPGKQKIVFDYPDDPKSNFENIRIRPAQSLPQIFQATNHSRKTAMGQAKSLGQLHAVRTTPGKTSWHVWNPETDGIEIEFTSNNKAQRKSPCELVTDAFHCINAVATRLGLEKIEYGSIQYSVDSSGSPHLSIPYWKLKRRVHDWKPPKRQLFYSNRSPPCRTRAEKKAMDSYFGKCREVDRVHRQQLGQIATAMEETQTVGRYNLRKRRRDQE